MTRKKQELPQRECPYCGEWFTPKAAHYWLCWPCWKARQESDGDTDTDLPAPTTAVQLLAEFREQLPKLLQLVHPDKHAGSSLANEVTQWLLKIRKEIKQQFQSH